METSAAAIQTFVCTGCNENKPINRFRTTNALKRGHAARCKDCHKKNKEGKFLANIARRASLIRDGAIKKCTSCKANKLYVEFSGWRGNSDGTVGLCKACSNTKHTDWRARSKRGEVIKKPLVPRNVERLKVLWRASALRAKYNLTEDDRKKMIKEQDGRCAICGDPFDFSKPNFHNVVHIDHNHLTNKVRGLLCTRCNFGIGHFRENRKLLLSAVEYLKKHGEDK